MGQTILTGKLFKMGIFSKFVSCSPDYLWRPSWVWTLHSWPRCMSSIFFFKFSLILFLNLFSSSISRVIPCGLFSSWFWQCRWQKVWHFAGMICSMGCTVCNGNFETWHVQCNTLTPHWLTQVRIMPLSQFFSFFFPWTFHSSLHIAHLILQTKHCNLFAV